MKEVLLITYNNKYYTDEFLLAGYKIKKIDQPFREEDISKVNNFSSNGIVIIEIMDENIEILTNLIKIFNKNSVQIVGIANKITDKLMNFLISHGIVDIIESKDAKRIINLIANLEKNDHSDFAKILILDDNVHRRNFFETIIIRFHHRPIFIKSIDELFDIINQNNFQLILVNLGTTGFDINKFIKISLSSSMIKTIPVIPYKDTTEDIFIHEVISGLNRLAKVILTSNELYSLLVTVLFRKEITQLIHKLNDKVELKNFIQFSNEPLKKIYYSLGDNIYSLKDIVTGEKLGKINEVIEDIKTVKVLRMWTHYE